MTQMIVTYSSAGKFLKGFLNDIVQLSHRLKNMIKVVENAYMEVAKIILYF